MTAGEYRILELYCDDGHTKFCEYTKNQRIVHFKRLNFMVCELYFNKAVIFF